MPYVLKHKNSGEIFSCRLVNIYDLPYHGAKAWEEAAEAEAERDAFLADRSQRPDDWELFELEESKLKLCNVKLNNNPNRRLYWEPDGRLTARPADGGA